MGNALRFALPFILAAGFAAGLWPAPARASSAPSDQLYQLVMHLGRYGDSVEGGEKLQKDDNDALSQQSWAMNIVYLSEWGGATKETDLVYCVDAMRDFRVNPNFYIPITGDPPGGYKPVLNEADLRWKFGSDYKAVMKKIIWITENGFQPNTSAVPGLDIPGAPGPNGAIPGVHSNFGDNDMTWWLEASPPSLSTFHESNYGSFSIAGMKELEAFMATQMAIWTYSDGFDIARINPGSFTTPDTDSPATRWGHIKRLYERLIDGAEKQSGSETILPEVAVTLTPAPGATLSGGRYGPVAVTVRANFSAAPASVPVTLNAAFPYTLTPANNLSASGPTLAARHGDRFYVNIGAEPPPGTPLATALIDDGTGAGGATVNTRHAYFFGWYGGDDTTPDNPWDRSQAIVATIASPIFYRASHTLAYSPHQPPAPPPLRPPGKPPRTGDPFPMAALLGALGIALAGMGWLGHMGHRDRGARRRQGP